MTGWGMSSAPLLPSPSSAELAVGEIQHLQARAPSDERVQACRGHALAGFRQEGPQVPATVNTKEKKKKNQGK